LRDVNLPNLGKSGCTSPTKQETKLQTDPLNGLECPLMLYWQKQNHHLKSSK